MGRQAVKRKRDHFKGLFVGERPFLTADILVGQPARRARFASELIKQELVGFT